MFTRIAQLVLSLLLIAGSLAIIFVFVFKSGHLTHRELWHTLLGLFLVLLLLLNIHPHWSVEKKHGQFFRDFVARADSSVLSRLFGERDIELVEDAYRPFVRMVSGDVQSYVSANNSVEVITEGARKYELLMRDLENAKESIHMEYFHFGADKGSRDVRDMLIKKAREGVKVRFINENIANFPIIHRYYRSMRKGGVEVIRFTGFKNLLSTLNYRNHRKVVVIDGKIGYTGGMNINDHYFRQWRDTHMRLEGDAAAQLQLLFLDSWIISGGKMPDDYNVLFPEAEKQASQHLVQIVADEPGLGFHPIQGSYQWALLHAKEYFYMQTPYFIPSEPVLEALKTAARAGADVRLMIPKKSDTAMMGPANKSFFKECLQSGVRIFEREGNFMHCKTFVTDDYLSSIGTANLDNRSFKLNYEDNAYLYDREIAAQNRDIFLRDLDSCTEVTLAEVESWPWYQVYLQKTLRLVSSVL
ncbi:MAG: cardiolipin synthase [Bacteroidales bacterium]|nr:cardiolipin synthase [Bacteroidales bacterium]